MWNFLFIIFVYTLDFSSEMCYTIFVEELDSEIGVCGMKYYYIKCTNFYKGEFEGTIVEYLYGRGQNMISRKVVKASGGYVNHQPEFDHSNIKYYAMLYGYTKRGMAESVMRRTQRDANTVCEIVEVDI